jgi:sec-independent protein translocase protein TatB|tara:strand:- start:4966 stop:5202 length:237 start_codon:yes stop_codon:yes gene_type:complete
MPQIGWFEILIIVVLAILIIGPKDFPVMLKKIGSWVSSFKNYFSEVQRDITDVENVIEDEISAGKDLSNVVNDNKKDE